MRRTTKVASVIAAAMMLLCFCACSSSHDIPAISELKSKVTAKNLSEYDFTEKALEYFHYIGENYPLRGIYEETVIKPNEEFGDWLIKELTNHGYASQQISEQRFSLETEYFGYVEGRNIEVVIPGKKEGQIIVGAHYDGPGFADNGSGTALLLATAVGLVNSKPQYTLRFVFFDREEEGSIGSGHYASQMSEESIASTIYMINMDALIFGDFCNIYGGIYGDDYAMSFIIGNSEEKPEVRNQEGYDFAADQAELLGFKVYRPEDLDGYFAAHGHGMDVQDDAFFTNPWTNENPAPLNMEYIGPSPSTLPISDHVPFAVRGIPYICFEASNWWAEGPDPFYSYTGYVETYDESIGEGGMIMNTEYDTPETLQKYFSGRDEKHYRLYSPLLSSLLLVK
ncbi:MAG: M28 family peptidase [Dehalococcoidales bacterium]|nr:M28 family peptidase [Dehalococcoidales bacterium]